MSHPVPFEALKVFRPEPGPVSQFHTVRPAGGQLSQKIIQVRDEIAAMLIIVGPETRELKDQQANLRLNGRTRSQEAGGKQICVQKIFVRFAGQIPEAIQLGKFFQRHGVSHFEGKPEVVRNLLRHSLEVLLGREGIIGGVHTHGFEDSGILFKATAIEARLGEAPPVLVPPAVVQRAKPAGIFPRRGANKYALAGELTDLPLYQFKVELHRRIITSHPPRSKLLKPQMDANERELIQTCNLQLHNLKTY